MAATFTPELAAALVGTQGVSTTPQRASDDSRFAASLLERSANAFSRLAFEDEPAGFVAAQRSAAP